MYRITREGNSSGRPACSVAALKRCTLFFVADAAYSHDDEHLDRAVMSPHQRVIIPGVAAVVLIGVGFWGFGGTRATAPAPGAMAVPAREQTSNKILETTKGLEITQQQAVDQLQIVQGQLAAQQLETKKLSAQIAALTDKLDALQGSVGNISAPPPAFGCS
jgi:uncharacterized coiled-coil protein SlyX